MTRIFSETGSESSESVDPSSSSDSKISELAEIRTPSFVQARVGFGFVFWSNDQKLFHIKNFLHLV